MQGFLQSDMVEVKSKIKQIIYKKFLNVNFPSYIKLVLNAQP